jgi:hypothetical protein
MYIFTERMLGYQCFEAQICIVCSKKENAGDNHLIIGDLGLHVEDGLHR